MVLKSKLPSRMTAVADVPPWAKEQPFIQGVTGGVPWDWHDCLAAELAVIEARKALAEQRAADQQAEEFFEVYRYVARMGLLDFIVRFFQHLYFQWRYGMQPEDVETHGHG